MWLKQLVPTLFGEDLCSLHGRDLVLHNFPPPGTRAKGPRSVSVWKVEISGSTSRVFMILKYTLTSYASKSSVRDAMMSMSRWMFSVGSGEVGLGAFKVSEYSGLGCWRKKYKGWKPWRHNYKQTLCIPAGGKVKDTEKVESEECTGVQQGPGKAGHLCRGPWRGKQGRGELSLLHLVMRMSVLMNKWAP